MMQDKISQSKIMNFIRFPIVVFASLLDTFNNYIVDTKFFLAANLLLLIILFLSVTSNVEIYLYMIACLIVFAFFKIPQKYQNSDCVGVECNTPSLNVLFYGLSIALPIYSKQIIKLLPKSFMNFKLAIIAFLPMAITFLFRLLYVVPTAAICCNKQNPSSGKYNFDWFSKKARGVAFACVSDFFADINPR